MMKLIPYEVVCENMYPVTLRPIVTGVVRRLDNLLCSEAAWWVQVVEGVSTRYFAKDEIVFLPEAAPAPTVKFKKLHDEATIPSYANPGDAGMDLHCVGIWVVGPKQRVLVPCGVAIEIPDGYEGQVRPRSGNALKKGVTVLNSPGTIDSGYRGEVMVMLYNTTEDYIEFNHGDRIGQLVIAPVSRATIEVVEELSDSERGEGGWGSTGR